MTNTEDQQLVEFLTAQFGLVDQRFAAIDRRFETIDQRFAAIDQRFETLEQRMGAGFREVLGHLDAIDGRLERLEQEYLAIVEGMRRIETLLTEEKSRREILERGLAEPKERVTLLQARIDELERRLRG